MKFKTIEICNFRNFENVKIDIENKNILFGLNDIGKTNFLYALRFLFDKECRKLGIIESDFHKKDTSRTIKIIVEIDISKIENEDNKKIRRWMAGSIESQHESVFMKLEAKYNQELVSIMPELFWGSNESMLDPIPSSQAYYDIDKIFNVVYIDSSVQLESVFKYFTKTNLRKSDSINIQEKESIKKTIELLNSKIGKLDRIQEMQTTIKKEYIKYRNEKDFDISIKSEIELENVYSKLIPYINYNSGIEYPTSGDGRRKLLAYTLLSLQNRKYEERKINIFLIEELENHLHRSMQMAISRQLFTDDIFRYMFLTTHSSLIVSSMDEVNLIKLYKTNKTDGKSIYYRVPSKYKRLKEQLNQNLAEAIYADYVLLVEGPSEKILFETIMKEKCPQYELFGGYILVVNGISFKSYRNILHELSVKTIIKTDNDLKYNKNKNEFNHLGLNRALKIIMEEDICNVKYDKNKFETEKINIQKRIYDETHNDKINLLKLNSVYLSRVDLENDLYEAIQSHMDKFIKNKNTTKNPIDYIQDKKMINMIELCAGITAKITINKIYNHPLFKCLKEFTELCNQ